MKTRSIKKYELIHMNTLRKKKKNGCKEKECLDTPYGFTKSAK